MHLLSSTISIALLTSSLAAAIPVTPPLSFKRTTTANTTTWPVSNFTVGCSPAACVYHFNVWRASGPSNPGFNTTCTGNDFTSNYQACSDTTVYARIVPESGGVWQVDVRHKYATDQSGGYIEAWANATVDDSMHNFAVTVYQTDGAE